MTQQPLLFFLICVIKLKHSLTLLWQSCERQKYRLHSLIISHDRWQGWRGIKGLTLKAWRQYEPFSAYWPSHNTPLVLFFSSNQLEVLGSHYLRLSCIGFLPLSIILEPFCRWSLITDYFRAGSTIWFCVCVCVCVCFSFSVFGPLVCY